MYGSATAIGERAEMNGLREEAAATLPYLRRYARALTGSQPLGDQWVRMCVEVLLQ